MNRDDPGFVIHEGTDAGFVRSSYFVSSFRRFCLRTKLQNTPEAHLDDQRQSLSSTLNSDLSTLN